MPYAGPVPKDKPEPTQQTEKGHTIPVPKKADVLRDLAKVAKPSADRDGGTEQ